MQASGCLMQLAACKIDVDDTRAPNFDAFKAEWVKRYRDWIGVIKMHALREGIPLRAELLDLVYDDADSLGHAAEREAPGFNERNLPQAGRATVGVRARGSLATMRRRGRGGLSRRRPRCGGLSLSLRVRAVLLAVTSVDLHPFPSVLVQRVSLCLTCRFRCG
jgi:hypothetical protein